MFETGTSIIIKRANKWHVAEIGAKGQPIKLSAPILKLANVSKKHLYISLKQYLKLNEREDIEPATILQTLGVTSLYIIKPAPKEASKEEAPTNLTPKQWESQWFSEKNQLCISCKRKCKQSKKVEILQCTNYALQK